MDDFNWGDTCAIVREIVSYNLETFFKVENGGLEVGPKFALCDEQKFLIKAHRDAIIQYLTTPPNVVGMCLRGHERRWRCSPHGTWLCECFFGPYDVKKYRTSRKKDVRSYWTDMAIAN